MTHWLAVREHDPNTHLRRTYGQVTRHVVGAVAEGDSVAHALYRVVYPGPPRHDAASVKILRLRRQNGGWDVWPYPSDFEWWMDSLVRVQLVTDTGGPPR